MPAQTAKAGSKIETDAKRYGKQEITINRLCLLTDHPECQKQSLLT